MKVWVNGSETEVFCGARVKDAILKYSHSLYKQVMKNTGFVTDHDSNPIEPDGELSPGQRLFTRDGPGPFE